MEGSTRTFEACAERAEHRVAELTMILPARREEAHMLTRGQIKDDRGCKYSLSSALYPFRSYNSKYIYIYYPDSPHSSDYIFLLVVQ
mmetsp:Transcript_16565/g.37222  ORF Transcript_16565/g.37222 Transcript_16565/m.37222 type:complete len:87 (-) Transcript_16565:28-288(-)